MAVDDDKKMNSSVPEGTIESLLSYLKERIESPFLMSFLFSWSVVNRDFMFYLFMSNESNKHNQLANWDYSGFIFNCDWFSWYSPWADSFWLPLAFALIMTLMFSPISIVISGLRYYFLKRCINFAKGQKQQYEMSFDFERISNYLNSLNENKRRAEEEIIKLQNRKNRLDEEYKKIQDNYLCSKRGELTDFLIRATEFAVNYKSGKYSQTAASQFNKIHHNAVIKVEFKNLDSFSDNLTPFEGTAFDFVTNRQFFNWYDEDSFNCLITLINNLDVDRPLDVKINQLGNFKCSLTDVRVYI